MDHVEREIILKSEYSLGHYAIMLHEQTKERIKLKKTPQIALEINYTYLHRCNGTLTNLVLLQNTSKYSIRKLYIVTKVIT